MSLKKRKLTSQAGKNPSCLVVRFTNTSQALPWQPILESLVGVECDKFVSDLSWKQIQCIPGTSSVYTFPVLNEKGMKVKKMA